MSNAGVRIPACIIVVLVAAAPGARAQDPVRPAATTQPCVFADDPQFGAQPDKPIQVGGGPMYGAARQRRYVDALRGPGGEPIAYKRLGSALAPDDDTMLDRYEVTYEGLTEPRILYLDWYHFVEPRAPRGFTCGAPFELGLPPPDRFTFPRQLAALAVTQGSDKAFKVAPIDIGEPLRARVFDHFRLVARAARAAAGRGEALNADSLPPDLARPRTIVLAHPLTCGDRLVLPASVAIADSQGHGVPVESAHNETVQVIRLLPGVQVPAGALAVVFPVDTIRPGSLVITYREPACTDSTSVTIPLSGAVGRMLASPDAVRPAGSRSTDRWIAVQAVLDHSGAVREAIALGGSPDAVKAALEAVREWRAAPTQVNGGPIAIPIVLQVWFADSRRAP